MRTTTAALTLLLLFTMACASASVAPVQRFVNPADIHKPTMMLIYDFGFSPNDVDLNRFGGEVVRGPAPTEDEIELGRKIAETFASRLVAKLNESGIDAVRADQSSATPLHSLLVMGHFVTISEGSRLKRVVIGFGAGATKLSALADVYQVDESGRTKVSLVGGEAQGNKKPGMAVPMAGGAAVGSLAVSAAVSGGLALVSETVSGTEKDAENLADKFAERAVTVYQEEGWL